MLHDRILLEGKRESRKRRFLNGLRKKLGFTSRAAPPTWSNVTVYEPRADSISLSLLDDFDATCERFATREEIQHRLKSGMDHPYLNVPIDHAHPALFRVTNPNQPFRFLDLPIDIKLMIIDYLINPCARKRWRAFITQSVNGIQFLRKSPTAQYLNEPVIWRNNNESSTRSLLLTSQTIRDLTICALLHCFSGKLCPQGHRMEGLSDPGIPDEFFKKLVRDSPFVVRNAWVFDRVTHLSVDRRWMDWVHAAAIMPQLKTVTLRHHVWTNVIVKNGDNSRDKDFRSAFLAGDMNASLLRISYAPPVYERHVEEHWPKYRQALLSACSLAVAGRKDFLEIYICFTEIKLAWLLPEHYGLATYNKLHELSVWPQIGKIRE